jgi:hypothetical protein
MRNPKKKQVPLNLFIVLQSKITTSKKLRIVIICKTKHFRYENEKNNAGVDNGCCGSDIPYTVLLKR